MLDADDTAPVQNLITSIAAVGLLQPPRATPASPQRATRRWTACGSESPNGASAQVAHSGAGHELPLPSACVRLIRALALPLDAGFSCAPSSACASGAR
jgi:hypothetical protein